MYQYGRTTLHLVGVHSDNIYFLHLDLMACIEQQAGVLQTQAKAKQPCVTKQSISKTGISASRVSETVGANRPWWKSVCRPHLPSYLWDGKPKGSYAGKVDMDGSCRRHTHTHDGRESTADRFNNKQPT